jgi:IclR family transcriptional regulator, KDG regulon repressor
LIKSVISAFEILNCFVTGRRRLSFNELERMTGMSKSSLHSLLESLEEVRAITRDQATGQYHLGYRLIQYADTARKLSILEVAEPAMERLRDEIEETVSLATMEDWHQVIIAISESTRILRVAPKVGVRNCMHYTAVGKAMLAHLPIDEVRRIIETAGMPRATTKTITSGEELERDLERVRKLGYSIDNMEHNDDVRCIGSAVLDRDGRPVAGISISGPSFRVHEEDFTILGEKVRRAADQISHDIGGLRHAEEPRKPLKE